MQTSNRDIGIWAQQNNDAVISSDEDFGTLQPAEEHNLL
jgi:hypothetical protein